MGWSQFLKIALPWLFMTISSGLLITSLSDQAWTQFVAFVLAVIAWELAGKHTTYARASIFVIGAMILGDIVGPDVLTRPIWKYLVGITFFVATLAYLWVNRSIKEEESIDS